MQCICIIHGMTFELYMYVCIVYAWIVRIVHVCIYVHVRVFECACARMCLQLFHVQTTLLLLHSALLKL